MKHKFKFILYLIITLLTISQYTTAAVIKDENFSLSADFRVRLEHDWDSFRSDSTERSDRSRLRIRARVSASFLASENLSLGMRLRTGSDDSHQSPHITLVDFNDNDTGDAHLNFDKWFLKYKKQNNITWIGRNSTPFWKQNEFFWDDDATVAGIGNSLKLGNQTKLNAGYFTLPAGMKEFAGNMVGLQGVYQSKHDKYNMVLALGYYNLDAAQNDTDAGIFLNNNGSREYSIVQSSLQIKWLKDKPVTLGIDLYSNQQNYSATDPDAFTAANYDNTSAHIASIKFGQVKQAGDWQWAYYYAHIEALAINNSFAQDDWVRWGSATQTRASNLEGHEFRAVYGIYKNINLVTRLYITEAITSVEDGNRFRMDLNLKF